MAQITVELDKETEPSQTVMSYRPLGEPNAESIAAMDEWEDPNRLRNSMTVDQFKAWMVQVVDDRAMSLI